MVGVTVQEAAVVVTGQASVTVSEVGAVVLGMVEAEVKGAGDEA
jgi:hypothetical protein